MKLAATLTALPVWGVRSVGVALIFLLGLTDIVSGYELSFSIFYLAPIAFITWYADRISGFVAAAVGGATWLAADLLAGHVYSAAWIPVWNAGVRFGFFIVTVMLLAQLRRALDRERHAAATDALTGAANTRAFYAAAARESARCRRHGRPLTLAYIDLDDFKHVNDRLGHETGDRLLCAVAQILQEHVRRTDVVGRLGGDEFAVLFPELDGPSAVTAVTKLHHQLKQRMQQDGWAVGFSIGVVTFATIPEDLDEMVKQADDLMYHVKRTTKNAIRHETHDRRIQPAI